MAFYNCDNRHKCYDDDLVCGCWCDGCVDETEPRCEHCNSILEDGKCPEEVT